MVIDILNFNGNFNIIEFVCEIPDFKLLYVDLYTFI